MKRRERGREEGGASQAASLSSLCLAVSGGGSAPHALPSPSAASSPFITGGTRSSSAEPRLESVLLLLLPRVRPPRPFFPQGLLPASPPPRVSPFPCLPRLLTERWRRRRGGEEGRARQRGGRARDNVRWRRPPRTRGPPADIKPVWPGPAEIGLGSRGGNGRVAPSPRRAGGVPAEEGARLRPRPWRAVDSLLPSPAASCTRQVPPLCPQHDCASHDLPPPPPSPSPQLRCRFIQVIHHLLPFLPSLGPEYSCPLLPPRMGRMAEYARISLARGRLSLCVRGGRLAAVPRSIPAQGPGGGRRPHRRRARHRRCRGRDARRSGGIVHPHPHAVCQCACVYVWKSFS